MVPGDMAGNHWHRGLIVVPVSLVFVAHMDEHLFLIRFRDERIDKSRSDVQRITRNENERSLRHQLPYAVVLLKMSNEVFFDDDAI